MDNFISAVLIMKYLECHHNQTDDSILNDN